MYQYSHNVVATTTRAFHYHFNVIVRGFNSMPSDHKYMAEYMAHAFLYRAVCVYSYVLEPVLNIYSQ